MLQIASYFLIQILIRHDASKWIRKHRNAASFIIKRTYANWRQKKYKGVKKRTSTRNIFLAQKSETIAIFQILIRHDVSKWIRKNRNAASFIIKRTYANWRQKK